MVNLEYQIHGYSMINGWLITFDHGMVNDGLSTKHHQNLVWDGLGTFQGRLFCLGMLPGKPKWCDWWRSYDTTLFWRLIKFHNMRSTISKTVSVWVMGKWEDFFLGSDLAVADGMPVGFAAKPIHRQSRLGAWAVYDQEEFGRVNHPIIVPRFIVK